MTRASHRILPRLRVAVMAVVLTITGLGLDAAPSARPADPAGDEAAPFSLPLPFTFGPQTALASYCASTPSFTGKLTQQLVNSGTPSTAGRITSPTIYGWISNVISGWSCTLYRRYSGLAWNTTPTKGKFQWGTLINSTSVACNWGVGSTDYLKANDTSTCPGTDTSQHMTNGLSAERVYQQDVNHDTEGDFSFVHSDCDTTPYYGSYKAKGGEDTAAVGFGSGADNRPGNNCDAPDLDGTGTGQTVTYDATAPRGGTISINGGAAYAVTQSATLTLSAIDDVAGLDAMRFSNDGTTWSNWQPYATSASWTLAPGDGLKTVSVQFRDLNLNVSGAWSDTITLDTTSPVASLMTPEAGLPVMGDVPVTGVAADATSFQGYTLDYGAGTSPSTWTTIATSTTAVPTAGALGTWAAGTLATGTYTLRLTVIDTAGSAPATDTHQVYVDNTRRGAEPYLSSVPFDLGGGWDLGVSVATGEASLSRSLFSIPSYGPPAGLDLAYNSGDTAAAGPLGFGWSSNLTQTLTADGAFRVWKRADGGRVPFGQGAGT